MNITEVNKGISKNKSRKRVGRGTGSGIGRYSGRGAKGDGSRSGHHDKGTFEGGMLPTVQRIPMRGFNNQFADVVFAVNVGDLDATFEDGDVVSVETLKELGIIKNSLAKKFVVLKILGVGEMTKKLTVKAHKFSKTAAEKLTAAGCTMEIAEQRKPVVKNKMKAK